MKNILIVLCLILSVYGCSERQSGKLVFNSSKTEGINVETDNIETVEKPGKFIASGPKAKVTYLPVTGVWNLDQFVFLDCEVENLSDQVQLVELMINGDRWTMGGVYVEPGNKKIVRAIILRQNPTREQMSQFPNMNAYPGGSIRLWWKSYRPDSIKAVSLYFPLTKSGDILKIGRASATGELKTYNDEEYLALMPFVDEYGQFIHKEWPGKIKNTEDLIAADTRESADLKANPGYTEMSKFGGWKNGPVLKATGHFRVEKYNGVWAIVDPEGYLFWSHGIDCVRPSAETPVEGREQFYKFLPDASGEFSDFVSQGRVSTTYTPDTTGKINLNSVKFVNFYGMNLRRKWGDDYKNKFSERTIERLKSWEINTIANWSDKAVFEKREIPYLINVGTARSRMLTDPFDPSFQSLVENQLTANYPKSLDDPWCLGIFVDNEISWGNEWAIGTNVFTTPRYPFAREVMIGQLKIKYVTITALNEKWSSNFKSWKELNDTRESFSGASDDFRLMSGLFAEEYFTKCKSAIKKVAPDKLYLGCRFDFHFYPEKDNNGRDWIVPYGGKYADIVSFNRYNYSCNTVKPPDNLDFPIIIGEFHLGALDLGLPHSGLRHSTNQVERALVYKNFMMQAVQNPYIVGVGWFQYIDQAYTGRNDGENYQIGFITTCDYPNQELIESAREVGINMYKERYGNKN